MNYRQIDIVIVTTLTGVNSILHMAPRGSFGAPIFSLFFFSLTGGSFHQFDAKPFDSSFYGPESSELGDIRERSFASMPKEA